MPRPINELALESSASAPDGRSPSARARDNVYVRDQEQSLRFYRDRLGFDLAFDAQLQTGERWVAVSPPDGSALLTLVAPRPDSREHQLIGRPTGVVFVTDDVLAKYSEWRLRDVRFQYAPRLRRVKYERQPLGPR